MSVIPNITLGIDGKSQTNTLGMMPPTGFPYDAIGNRTPLMYGPYTKAPNMLSAAIDYSTRRGVLPTVQGHHIPRITPTSYMSAICWRDGTHAPICHCASGFIHTAAFSTTAFATGAGICTAAAPPGSRSVPSCFMTAGSFSSGSSSSELTWSRSPIPRSKSAL